MARRQERRITKALLGLRVRILSLGGLLSQAVAAQSPHSSSKGCVGKVTTRGGGPTIHRDWSKQAVRLYPDANSFLGWGVARKLVSLPGLRRRAGRGQSCPACSETARSGWSRSSCTEDFLPHSPRKSREETKGEELKPPRAEGGQSHRPRQSAFGERGMAISSLASPRKTSTLTNSLCFILLWVSLVPHATDGVTSRAAHPANTSPHKVCTFTSI